MTTKVKKDLIDAPASELAEGLVQLATQAEVDAGLVDNKAISPKNLAATPSAGGFPAGTVLAFFQASAPVGWTQIVTHNDKALRVVNGSGGGSGGTHGLTAPPSLNHTHSGPSHTHSIGSHTHSTSGHTLSIAEIPSHGHDQRLADDAGSGPSSVDYVGYFKGVSKPSTDVSVIGNKVTGGGGSHNHGNTGGASGTTGSASGTTGSAAPTPFAPQYIDMIVCTKD